MKIELLDCTEDAEYKIGLYASKCYGSSQDREACIRRVKSCKESGHLAVLRFAYATFDVTGISRVCSHQLVRHAHLSYLQTSQRYTKPNEFDYVNPDALEGMEEYFQHEWFRVQAAAESLYFHAVNNKLMKKEDARFILPQGCETSMVVTGNFQAWIDFINLRSERHAQHEIRQVALEIKRQLAEKAPSIFGG